MQTFGLEIYLPIIVAIVPRTEGGLYHAGLRILLLPPGWFFGLFFEDEALLEISQCSLPLTI